MKKQLFLLFLLPFALGAMDPPEIEPVQEEIVQESNFPSLVQLCVPAAAKQLQKDDIRKQFLEEVLEHCRLSWKLLLDLVLQTCIR